MRTVTVHGTDARNVHTFAVLTGDGDTLIGGLQSAFKIYSIEATDAVLAERLVLKRGGMMITVSIARELQAGERFWLPRPLEVAPKVTIELLVRSTKNSAPNADG
jgi:hypothetical protein